METARWTAYHTDAAMFCLISFIQATSSGDSCTIAATLARYNQRIFPVHVSYLYQDHLIVCTDLEFFDQFIHDLAEIFAIRTDLYVLTTQCVSGARSLSFDFISFNMDSDNFFAVLWLLQAYPLQFRLELTCSMPGLALSLRCCLIRY